MRIDGKLVSKTVTAVLKYAQKGKLDKATGLIARRPAAVQNQVMSQLTKKAISKYGMEEGINLTANIRARQMTKNIFGDLNKLSSDLSSNIAAGMNESLGVSFNNLKSTLPTEVSENLGKILWNGFKKDVKNIPAAYNQMLDKAAVQINKKASSAYKKASRPFIKRKFNKIPQEYQTALRKLSNVDDEKFMDAAYHELKKTMGMSKTAPEKIELGEFYFFDIFKTQHSGNYDPIAHNLFFEGSVNRLLKTKKINLLAHELKHVEQHESVIRTHGLDYYINLLKGKFGTEFTPSLESELRIKLANIAQKPKINPASVEGQHVSKYVDAIKNYTMLNRDNTGKLVESAGYRTNLLEVEAYQFGGKIEKWMNWAAKIS